MKFCILCIMADTPIRDAIRRAAAIRLQNEQLRDQRELLEYERAKEQKKKELKRKLEDEKLAEHALQLTTDLLHVAQDTLGQTSMEVDRVVAREIKKPKAALEKELLEKAIHGTPPVPATPSGAAGGAASSAATPSGAAGGPLSVFDVPVLQVIATTVLEFLNYG
jgi:(p)ppGpp synthase/HD superfamily hydrolase